MKSQLSEKEIEIFETMPVPRAVAALAVPTVISQIIAMVYNIADTWYIGQLNDTGMMAAVTLVFPAFLMLSAVANLFGIGGASLLSRSLGRRDYEMVRRAGASAAWLAAAATLVYSLAVFVWREPLLSALGADENSLPHASAYLFWTVTVGGLPTSMNMVLAHLIRAEGQSKRASFGMSLGGVLNVALDPIFIYDWGFGLAMEGAAIATALSNAIATLYLLYYLLKPREDNVVSLSPRYVSLARNTAGEIFFVGLPATVQLVMNALSNITLNYLMSAYTAGALSAVGIVKKIDQVPTYIVQGICSGVIPLLAYNYASGDYKRLWRCTYFAGLCSLAVTLSYLAMCETIPAALIRIFMEDASAVSAGSVFLRLHCVSIPFLSIISLIIAFFQATGRGKPALVLSFLRKGPIDIPLMWFMNIVWPMYGIMSVQPMMDIAVASVCVATYKVMQKRDRRRAGAGL